MIVNNQSNTMNKPKYTITVSVSREGFGTVERDFIFQSDILTDMTKEVEEMITVLKKSKELL